MHPALDIDLQLTPVEDSDPHLALAAVPVATGRQPLAGAQEALAVLRHPMGLHPVTEVDQTRAQTDAEHHPHHIHGDSLTDSGTQSRTCGVCGVARRARMGRCTRSPPVAPSTACTPPPSPTRPTSD